MQHVCLRNEKSSPILLLFSFCFKCQVNQETPKHLFWCKTFLYGHMKILNQFHKSHPYFGASKLSIELIAKTSPYSQHLIKLRKNQVWVANDITFRCYWLAQMVVSRYQTKYKMEMWHERVNSLGWASVCYQLVLIITSIDSFIDMNIFSLNQGQNALKAAHLSNVL